MEDLTLREREALAILAKRIAYKQIGGELGISLDTARMHQPSVREKLNVHCRSDAVMIYIGAR